MPKSAALIGDPIICPKSTGPITHIAGIVTTGSSGATINRKAAARAGDLTICPATGAIGFVLTGSDCVFIDGKRAATVESITSHGAVLTGGSSNVLIGSGGSGKVFITGNVVFGNQGQIIIGGDAPTATKADATAQDAAQMDNKKNNNDAPAHDAPFIAPQDLEDQLFNLIKKTQAQENKHIGTLKIKFINDYDKYEEKSPYPDLNKTECITTQTDANHTQEQQLQTKYKLLYHRDGKAVIYEKSLTNEIIINDFDLYEGFSLDIPHFIIAKDNKPISQVDTNFATSGLTDFDIKKLENKTREIVLTLLERPIIINLAKNSPSNSQKTLTENQIKYFQKKGNNATIFIHGFSVPFGCYAPYQSAKQINQEKSLMMENSAHLTDGREDLDKHNKPENKVNLALLGRFPAIAKKDELDNENKPKLDPDGTGAHNWFNHIEHNLNIATSQFDGANYLPYTRIINVAWDSDLFATEYMMAAKNAKDAGKDLAPVIKQLHDNNIEINIIAHSLGNEVLLSCMEEIGKSTPDAINHVFMWDAAVPDNCFTQDKNKINNEYYYFPNAYKACKKITVLYSQDDNVLGPKMERVLKTLKNTRAESSENKKYINDEIVVCAIEAVIKFIDDNSGIPNKINSIYNFANVLEHPFSYFSASLENCNNFYNEWLKRGNKLSPKVEFYNRQGGKFPKNFDNFINDCHYFYSHIFAPLYTLCAFLAGNYLQGALNLPEAFDDALNLTQHMQMKTVFKNSVYYKIFQEDYDALLDNIKTLAIFNDKIKLIAKIQSEIFTNCFRSHLPVSVKKVVDNVMQDPKITGITAIIMMVFMTDKLKVPRPLGYWGPDEKNDHFIWKLVNQDKNIIKNPQQDDNKNDVMLEHSGMKIPSGDVMKFVYKKVIMNKYKGLDKFGNYNIHEMKYDD